jgi:hypothetical protein
VWPELFERDLLQNEEFYKTSDNGVLTPCPYCGTNECVKQDGFTIYDRQIHSSVRRNATRTFIIGPKLLCCNPESPGAGKAKSKDKVSPSNNNEELDVDVDDDRGSVSTTIMTRGSTETTIAINIEVAAKKVKKPKVAASFTTWTGKCWSSYPLRVRRQYSDYVTRLDDGGSTFVTPDLCSAILDDRKTFADTANDLKESFGEIEMRAIAAYYNFVQDEDSRSFIPNDKPGTMDEHFLVVQPKKRLSPTQKWPDFDTEMFRDTFGNLPGKDAVKSIFEKAFELVEPHLLRDLLTRLPGRLMRWDGTFRLMKKTMNDPGSDGTNTVALLVFGEDGHIISFAFAESETDENIQRLLYFIRKQMLRLGGQHSVDAVISAYSDVCCENVTDVEKHWYVRMFPNATSPRKDLFHGLKLVTEETVSGTHPLNAAFCKGLRDCFLKWDEDSVNEALAMFLKDDNGGKGLVHEVARSNMLQTRRYTEGIKNFVDDNREEAEKKALELYKTIAAQDTRMAEAAKREGKAYRRYLKQPIEGVQRGTEAHLENFLVHYQKGCFKDPLPIDEMNVPSKEVPDDTSLKSPSRLIRKRGTNICENMNKFFNWIGEHVSRQGVDTTHAKALLFIL